MDIENLDEHTRNFIQEKVTSATKLIYMVVAFGVVATLILWLTEQSFFAGIVHLVELIQAVLLCSTALMGLSGLMIVEIRKGDTSGLSSDNVFTRTNTINTIAFFYEAHVFLRWGIVLSILSILFSCSFFILNIPGFTIAALVAFFVQVYFFLWGLMSWDLFF